MKKIDSVCVLTLGTSAQTVRVSGLACMVQNNSESASVYMKERRADGEDVTADNGWRLAPGERTPVPFTALDLSLPVHPGKDALARKVLGVQRDKQGGIGVLPIAL